LQSQLVYANLAGQFAFDLPGAIQLHKIAGSNDAPCRSPLLNENLAGDMINTY
jgi:hypothetical protein